MKPNTIFLLISFIWAVSEIVFGRMKYAKSSGENSPDRRSLRLLWITITVAVSAGVFLGLQGIGFVPGVSRWAFPLGVGLILLGLLIRWSAVFTLRKYFTSNVSILPEHRLVQNGLYRFIRHPAYTGSLLSFLGLGIAFSNWLSTLVIFLPILTAFLYRIRVEEEALLQALGETYRDYCKSVKRLIPEVY
ncbi:MAG TPA: isoprenylcysteine carboxylmethyltransferase family protein [Caldithrix sp.]|nr:isoprenylcysteine carboxylmethyltransferase family protein [Caldithrix sp.]